ncbi:MAG: sodium/glutamate symporter [Pyrinomonadaceae bacterium]
MATAILFIDCFAHSRRAKRGRCFDSGYIRCAPALGVICGSLTLTGGPATGLAFAGAFEQMGLAGAGALIIASATFGIFAASIVGNPVATWLIKRLQIAPSEKAQPVSRPYVIEQGEANDDLSFGLIIRTLCLSHLTRFAGWRHKILCFSPFQNRKI